MRRGRGELLESLLRVLNLLGRSRTGVTLQDIARELECSERTARRYVQQLETRMPLQCTRGNDRRKRWCFIPGFSLPRFFLQLDEAVTLARLRPLLLAQAIGPWRSSIVRLLDRLDRQVPRQLQSQMGELAEHFGSAPVHAPARVPTETVNLIESATRERRTLAVRYHNLQGQVRERHFDPYLVFLAENALYAVGFDHFRGRLRTLALDRVRTIVPTAAVFKRPKDFSPETFLDGLHRAHSGRRVEVTLHARGAAARLLTERPETPDQETRHVDDDWSSIRFQAPITPALTARILSFGPDVKVIKPERLKQQICSRLSQAQEIYQQESTSERPPSKRQKPRRPPAKRRPKKSTPTSHKVSATRKKVTKP